MTATVARSFGEDIAHDVCVAYLSQRPVFRTNGLGWWRRTARYLRMDEWRRDRVRRLPRYATELLWIGSHPNSPEDYTLHREALRRAWEIPEPEGLDRVLADAVDRERWRRARLSGGLHWTSGVVPSVTRGR